MATATPMPPKQQVTRPRRNPWVMGVAALPFLLCLVAIVGAIAVNPGALAVLPHGLGLGAFATWYAWRRNPWPRLVVEDVRVDDDWLYLGGERHARADIKTGLLVPGDGYVTVQLHRRGARTNLELRVASEDEGRVLLRQLGLAATQTVGSFRTMSRVHTSVWRTMGAVFSTLAGTGALAAGAGALLGPIGAGAMMLIGMATLLTLVLTPTRVEVGADGVLMRWLGRERFIDHDDIEHITADVVGFGNNRRAIVTLALRSSEKVAIPTGTARFDFGRAQGLAKRIETARDAFQRGESVHAEALLRRGERSHADWIKALQVGDARSSHRNAPVDRERLWRIVEDVAVEPLDRAVAAVALGGELGTDGRNRIDRTARATAAPRLRIALDAVAQGNDEAALAEALAALESETEKAAART